MELSIRVAILQILEHFGFRTFILGFSLKACPDSGRGSTGCLGCHMACEWASSMDSVSVLRREVEPSMCKAFHGYLSLCPVCTFLALCGGGALCLFCRGSQEIHKEGCRRKQIQVSGCFDPHVHPLAIAGCWWVAVPFSWGQLAQEVRCGDDL